jgi:hypothetical protein
MKDLSGYIDTLLDIFEYDYRVIFGGEIHVIDFYIYDYTYADEYVERALKSAISKVIDEYIPKGKIKYLININVLHQYDKVRT